MHIRPLEKKDLHPESGFFQTLADLSTTEFLGQQWADDIFEENEKKGFFTWVAVINKKIVGTVSCIALRSYAHRGVPFLTVHNVVIHHKWQGKKIGEALMQYLNNWASDKGYKIILDCSKRNTPFYEKCGYRQHEIGMRLDLRDE